MKHALLTLLATALVGTATAQTYLIVNGGTPIATDDIDRITYDEDDQFESTLLPGAIAADEQLTIFSQALQLTGLADSLKAYWYADYERSDDSDMIFYKFTYWDVAYFDEYRTRQFTVFAETDEVFRTQGISSLSDLKAYAKQVYDEVFPEDATISDPTNRRHSLNRFVAYHILPEGLPTTNLTPSYGGLMVNNFNRKKTDIAAWYATLMPGGSLKCSLPAGDDEGYYLNRRGLASGPDKYGYFIRGAKIIHGEQAAFNGYYYHIDQLLTYDTQTRDQVLGGERWRTDFITLSPDFMNNCQRRDYRIWDTDDSNAYTDGTHRAFHWNCIENFSNVVDSTPPLVMNFPYIASWCYQGDKLNVYDDFDITVKLPPLPPGEWEVRYGSFNFATRPIVDFYLNGELTAEAVDMTHIFENEPLPDNIMQGPSDYGAATYYGSYGSGNPFSRNIRLLRYILGRVQSDGKSDLYLRIKRNDDREGQTEMYLDYLEFCPAAIYNNTAIPED